MQLLLSHRCIVYMYQESIAGIFCLHCIYMVYVDACFPALLSRQSS